MCLLVFDWEPARACPLIFAGNRDEAHARPAQAAGFWDDAPDVLAGRDLSAGGTWLGVTAHGRYAVVTNYRDGLPKDPAPRSRGELVAGFLRSMESPRNYTQNIEARGKDYAGFSFLAGDRASLWYISNRGAAAQAVTPGLHGLSNHLLDTPWPKLTLSLARLELLIEQHHVTSDALFRLLADHTPAARDALPDTGIGPEREAVLSSPFVQDARYGTRCSSLLRLGPCSIRFSERRFDAAGRNLETRHFLMEEVA